MLALVEAVVWKGLDNLFVPINGAEFVAQYRPVAPRVGPRLVFVAEHVGRVIGFLFAIAD